MLLVLQTFFLHSLPLTCFSFFFSQICAIFRGVSKLLKKTCAAFNDSLQMNVEQEGIRLRACGSRVSVSWEEAIKITVSKRSHGPVGGDSSAPNSLNLPLHTRSVGVRRQPWSGPVDSLSAGNGSGQSDQETRPCHRGSL